MTRELPSALDVERHLLGAVLLFGGKAIAEMSPFVGPSDFYHPAHAAIATAAWGLTSAQKTVDQITVEAEMRRTERWELLRAFNGAALFATLTSDCIGLYGITEHAAIVREKAQLRRLAEHGAAVYAAALSERAVFAEVQAVAEVGLLAIGASAANGEPQFIRAAVHEGVKALEARFEHRGAVTGIATGFERLDGYTTGWQASELVILAARPSMGKTGIVMNAVAHAAIEHEIPALVFSLEMSTGALIERLFASESRIDATRLRTGQLQAPDWVSLTRGCGRLSEAPIWFDDNASPTISTLAAKVRRWRMREVPIATNPRVQVIVDYLQLVRGSKVDQRGTNREQEIAEVSRGLKAIAKENKCAVVALAQLNRAVESRADKRPGLSDLRESGQIEQDADVIAFIYRDEVYNKESKEAGIAEIILGKQRSGPLGTVRLKFLPQYLRFENTTTRDDEPFAPRNGYNRHAEAGE